MNDKVIQLKTFLSTKGKGGLLLLTMLIGAFVPQAHEFSYLIQYLLMVMLFFAFLDLEFKTQMLRKGVLWVLVANVAVAFVAYGALAPINLTLALSGFMTAIAPTAIAAPVIISFIEREVEYVIASVILTNISTAFVVPVALPFLIDTQIKISIWEVLQPVLIVMFVPLLLAQLVKTLPTDTQTFVRKGKMFSFPVWLVSLFIISAKASDFLRNETTDSIYTLALIALVSLVICILNFSIGALLGGREHWQESSQSLGQKNLSFVIWVALTFINPLVAMGPMFYILYHHSYNSWLIYQFERKRALSVHTVLEV